MFNIDEIRDKPKIMNKLINQNVHTTFAYKANKETLEAKTGLN